MKQQLGFFENEPVQGEIDLDLPEAPCPRKKVKHGKIVDLPDGRQVVVEIDKSGEQPLDGQLDIFGGEVRKVGPTRPKQEQLCSTERGKKA